MKKAINIIIAICAVVTLFTNCKKKEKGPIMTFKPGATYTMEDNLVARVNTKYKIGITAAPGDGDFLLGSFKLKRQYNEESEQVLESVTIVGPQQFNYDRDFEITTRPQFGVERHTFEVTDKDGKTKTLTIKLTTH